MSRLLLGVAALTLGVLFALLPLERASIEYTWEASSDGTSVPLLLIERVPDKLVLVFPCAAGHGEGSTLFASSRSPGDVPALTVDTDGQAITVTVPDGQADGPASIRVGLNDEPVADCQVRVSYDRPLGEMILNAGDAEARVQGLLDNPFELTGLHWSSDPTDVSAMIETSPFSATRNSSAQKIVLLVMAGLAVGAVWASKRRGWALPLRAGWWRLGPSEWSMLAVVIVVGFVDLPRVDDGRILTRARLLAGPELRSNVSSLFENRPVPQRWLYEWVLGTSVGWSDVIIVLRSLSLFAALVAWLLIRRSILPVIARGVPSRAVVATAWVMHVLFVAAWFATLRPEPLLVVLTVAVLAVVASWPREVRLWPYATVIGCLGLAIATHVSGLVAFFAAVPAIWWGLRDLRRDAPVVLAGVAWGGAFSFVAVFLGSNLRQSYLASTLFRDGGAHSLGPLDLFTYVEGAVGGSTLMRASFAFAAIGVIALLVRVVLAVDWTFDSHLDALTVGAGLLPLGLLLTPSKWLWHLAVLAPVATVGWAWIVNRLERRPSSTRAPLVLFNVLLGLIVAWSLVPAWSSQNLGGWGPVGLRHVSADIWSQRLPWLVGDETRWWLWVLLLMAMGGSISWVHRRRGGRGGEASAITWMLVASLGVLVPIQLLPPVIDSVVAGDDWTFVRQSVVGVGSAEVACGVATDTEAVLRSRERLSRGADDADALILAGDSRGGMLAPCYTMMGQKHGAWQVPSLLMGDPHLGQRRLLTEFDVVPIGCNSFPRSRADDRLCFSVLESAHPALSPTNTTWRSD
jgi:hypothetical protein